jgi:hypothetical protein
MSNYWEPGEFGGGCGSEVPMIGDGAVEVRKAGHIVCRYSRGLYGYRSMLTLFLVLVIL